MKPSYEVLGIEQFGHELLTSGDLDPVYLMLQGLESSVLSRFCVAYWCLYHCGAAAYIADSEDPTEFWSRLGEAASNTGGAPTPDGRWPRGKERRHWRGANASKSFADLFERYVKPEDFVEAIRTLARDTRHEPTILPFKFVDKLVQSHVGFGSWIAFKVGDMAEQCLGIPVDFSQAEVFMFDTPKDAARLLVKRRMGIPDDAAVHIKDGAIAKVVGYLVEHFATYPAPNGKRRVNLQEVETILCKWKSHCSGHYPLYNDIGEVTEQLGQWRHHSATARELYDKIPQGGL